MEGTAPRVKLGGLTCENINLRGEAGVMEGLH
jgi:hypothetical protein